MLTAGVRSQLASVKAAGIDGLNLGANPVRGWAMRGAAMQPRPPIDARADIEGYTGAPAPLTALVTELHAAMKAWHATSQLSFDLSIFPDGRG